LATPLRREKLCIRSITFLLSLKKKKKMPLQSPPPPRAASAEEPSPRPSTSSFPGSTKEDCERFVDSAVERDPTVKFMMEKLGEVQIVFFFFVRFRSNLFDLETSTNPRSQLPNHTGQHGQRRVEAGHARDGRGRHGAAVRERGRESEGGHED
jgi:hypothetical protein